MGHMSGGRHDGGGGSDHLAFRGDGNFHDHGRDHFEHDHFRRDRFSTLAFGGYPYYGDYDYGYYDKGCWQTERVNVNGHLRLRRVWACE